MFETGKVASVRCCSPFETGKGAKPGQRCEIAKLTEKIINIKSIFTIKN